MRSSSNLWAGGSQLSGVYLSRPASHSYREIRSRSAFTSIKSATVAVSSPVASACIDTLVAVMQVCILYYKEDLETHGFCVCIGTQPQLPTSYMSPSCWLYWCLWTRRIVCGRQPQRSTQEETRCSRRAQKMCCMAQRHTFRTATWVAFIFLPRSSPTAGIA